MQDSRAELRLDVIANHRNLARSELGGPLIVRDDEYRHAVEQAYSGREASLRVALDRLLTADRQVTEHHFGAAVAQSLFDIDRFRRGRKKSAIRGIRTHMG